MSNNLLSWEKGLIWKMLHKVRCFTCAAVGPEVDTSYWEEKTLTFTVSKETKSLWHITVTGFSSSYYELVFFKKPLSLHQINYFHNTEPAENKTLVTLSKPQHYVHSLVTGNIPFLVDFPCLDSLGSNNISIEDDSLVVDFSFSQNKPFFSKAIRKRKDNYVFIEANLL